MRLKQISSALISKEASTAGFDASDLLQEAYLQKAGKLNPGSPVNNREHFFSLMAHGMRQILIDRSRFRNAKKRIASFHEDWRTSGKPDARLAELNQLRGRLQKLDPQAHRVLALKMDFGLGWEEIATRTNLSIWQCRAEYNHAVHWLRERMVRR